MVIIAIELIGIGIGVGHVVGIWGALWVLET